MKELIRHILKEETEEIDQNVLNFLLRRYKIKELDLGENLKFKNLYLEVGGDYYQLSTWRSKKSNILEIINILNDYEIIEPINNFSNENDPYRQKIVRTIKKFLDKVM